METPGVKHLTFDIETMANLVWSWDVYKSQYWSAIAREAKWYPMSFAYKWGDGETKYCSLEQYRGYKPQIKRYKDGSFKVRPVNIKPLLTDLHKLWSDADIVSGWNSDKYDIARMNMLMIEAGLPPVPPFKKFDFMKEKKKLGYSDSNSLKETSRQFGTTNKLDNDGWPLWIACAEGDKEALRLMKEYCVRDVDATWENYKKIAPYIQNHPKVGVFDTSPSHGTVYPGRPDSCDVCGDKRMHQHTKRTLAGRGFRMQYKCYNCGHHQPGTKIHKPEGKTL